MDVLSQTVQYSKDLLVRSVVLEQPIDVDEGETLWYTEKKDFMPEQLS